MSEKSVAERLQVKNDRSLAIIDPPPGLDAPIGTNIFRADAAKADVVLWFTHDARALQAALAKLRTTISPTAIFWLAYPKLSSKLAADLNRDIIRAMVPDHGLDTVSQISIDDDWSALRLKRVA